MKLQARVLMAMACVNLAGALLLGCPKPPPDPNRPDAADAALPPAPSCEMACLHLQALGCDDHDACLEICSKIRREGFRRCVAAAPSCAAVSACGSH